MKKGVSIVIATFNGKDKLEQTLEHLSQQQVSCDTELILIDNASTDATKKFADAWWSTHGNQNIDYHSYQQPIPGKSFAQELGYSKAQYKYLLVCDDDNWLCKDYVQTAFEIMESNDNIGALGGWCEAVFEGDKPKWFESYARFYAVSKQGSKSGDVTHKKGCLYGAGMMIRKKDWEYLNELGFKPLLTCRKGNTLASGGDTEYSYVLRLLGYKMWYDERLYFKHFMPVGRMSLDYVSRIRKAMSESNFVVKAYLDKLNGRKQTQKKYFKNFLRQIKHHLFKNIGKRLVGNYEQKEQAKEYFRQLKRLLFKYKNYKENYDSIDNWLPKSK